MEEADIVVIGAGSGGAAAAGRLSEGGRYTVAVLEAGGRNAGLKTIVPGMMPFQGPATNWGFETVPQRGLNGRRGYQPRGRGLGGSSAINAMLYVRGHPGDYDEWCDLGCTGWGWDDVLPYFKRSEHNVRGDDALHGDAGPLWVSDQAWAHGGSHAFVDAAASLQIPVNDDFNGPRQDGAGVYQVTQKNGERWTASRAYLGERRGNLAILTEAMAERVLFADGRVWGVAYQRGGVSREIRARRAVILAGGAFQTPQLLMLSGIGPARHLREFGLAVRVPRAAVGAGLQDHIDYTASFETKGSYFLGRSAAGSLKSMGAMLRWLFARSGAMTTPMPRQGRSCAPIPQRQGPTSNSISLSRWSRIMAAPGSRGMAFRVTPACSGPKAAGRCGCNRSIRSRRRESIRISSATNATWQYSSAGCGRCTASFRRRRWHASTGATAIRSIWRTMPRSNG